VAESGEHLAGYARDLVLLERAGRDGRDAAATVDSLFRHAHSLKGMSAAMALDGIAALAHRAEDLVDLARSGGSALDAEAVDLLLAAGDALGAMVQAAASGTRPVPEPGLLERLDEAVRRRRDDSRTPPLDALGARPLAEPGPSLAQPAGGAPARGAPLAPALRAGPDAGREPASLAAPAHPAPVPTRRVRAEVEIAASCPVPAVRAFLVVKKLSALGAVAETAPAVDELRAGRLPARRLEVVLDTAETLQALERALSQISDLAGVTLRAEDPVSPAEPGPPAAQPGAAREGPDPARTVRVRTEILDGFLDAVGELILATARLREIGRAVPEAHRGALDEGVDRLHGIVKDLHDKVMAVRMTPLHLLTERLPRVARDLARATGKQVEVEIEGAEIEIDRAILEELSDPLVHVLRNAVDHGIEPPHLRLLAGKPETGKVALRARRERDRVILEISDDGRGMDPARLRDAAVARGVLRPDQAVLLSDREALLLACLPGVSTAGTVTEVSGRGVGMDAVKRTVEALGGTLELESAAGQGSRVTLRLPLTVAVQPVLLVRVGEEVLGLPIAKVHGAAQVSLAALDHSRGEPVLVHEGELVPVHELARLLGLPEAADAAERAVVVAEGEGGRIGLAVDALLGQHEAVLKPLGAPLDQVPGLSAVTVLGNGRPVFILDVPRLLG
jgi:two-component system chemotaxis sensor kinase CheA